MELVKTSCKSCVLWLCWLCLFGKYFQPVPDLSLGCARHCHEGLVKQPAGGFRCRRCSVASSTPNMVICLWVACLPFTHATTRKQVAEDIIKRVLSIPDYDKVFNSVLGRIQNNRQGLEERAKSTFSEDIDCEETEGGLSEYTESIENSRDRGLRHGTEPSLERMCIVNRTIHRLNTNEYEYRPAYFEEVRCGTASDDENRDNDYELCSIFGFSCVQRNKTIHLTRRRYTSDCWETKTLVIPGGCECMWPKYKL